MDGPPTRHLKGSTGPPPGLEQIAGIVRRAYEQWISSREPRGAIVYGPSGSGKTHLGIWFSEVVPVAWMHGLPTLVRGVGAAELALKKKYHQEARVVVADDADAWLLSSRRLVSCFKAEIDRGERFTLLLCDSEPVHLHRLGLRLPVPPLNAESRIRAFDILLSSYRIQDNVQGNDLVKLSRGYRLRDCDWLVREAIECASLTEFIMLHHFVEASKRASPPSKQGDADEATQWRSESSYTRDLLDGLGGTEYHKLLARLREALVAPMERDEEPKSAILYGPTGSGKSAALRWLGREAVRAGVSVLEIGCAQLLRPQLGATEKAIASSFRSARLASPCLLIFDNIDIIASPRGNDTTTEGTMDRAVGTLLIQLDGLRLKDPRAIGTNMPTLVAVVAATTTLSDVDTALLRPGRLGYLRCRFSLPQEHDRLDILTMIAAKLPLDSDARDVALPRVARDALDFSGAELRAVLSNAAALALKDCPSPDGQTLPANLVVNTDHIERAFSELSHLPSDDVQTK